MTRFWKYSKCAGSEKGCSIARKKAAKAVRSIVYDVMDGRAQPLHPSRSWPKGHTVELLRNLSLAE